MGLQPRKVVETYEHQNICIPTDFLHTKHPLHRKEYFGTPKHTPQVSNLNIIFPEELFEPTFCTPRAFFHITSVSRNIFQHTISERHGFSVAVTILLAKSNVLWLNRTLKWIRSGRRKTLAPHFAPIQHAANGPANANGPLPKTRRETSQVDEHHARLCLG